MVKTGDDKIKCNENEFKKMPKEFKTTPKIRYVRRQQVYVNDNMRLQLLLMINDFGLSCYQTAKVLNMPYTNCKVIYRVFREEKRIFSCSRSFPKADGHKEDH